MTAGNLLRILKDVPIGADLYFVRPNAPDELLTLACVQVEHPDSDVICVNFKFEEE